MATYSGMHTHLFHRNDIEQVIFLGKTPEEYAEFLEMVNDYKNFMEYKNNLKLFNEIEAFQNSKESK